MKRVLVSGSSGFVGREFVKALIARGDQVTCVDIVSDPRYWPPMGTVFFRQDIRSFLRMNKSSWDEFYHFAAIVGGRLTIENNPLAIATDLSIDSEVFSWLVQPQNIKTKLIYFSSSAAYPVELQTREHHCLLHENLLHFNGTRVGMPDMTYGFVKLAGEYLAKFAVEKHGASVAIYRPFGGYGEDQSFDYPFPSILRRVINRENPITVWGSGDQQRDFIHIDDIVEAVLTTHDKLAPGEVLNLGTGIPTSFMHLALRAAELKGLTLSVRPDTGKPEGVFSRVADPTKMLELYRPKVTLDAGILRVMESLDRNKTAL